MSGERSASAGRAVFLSYASQDAEAARRLAEALCAAGVEVWFDQSELRGGDAWDQKIRRQIKECALFVPIVSANTQARLEGYFRLEWKLAEDRSHLMAKGKPFILPVCIDGTNDVDAQVPDGFMLVQWTRLHRGDGAPTFDDPRVAAFCARVQALLSGHPGARPPSPTSSAQPPGQTALPGKNGRRWLMPAVVLGLGAIAALAIWRPWRADDGAVPVARQAVSPEAEQLTTRALTIYSGVHSRPEVEMAEQMARSATELAPLWARAWAVRAGVEANYLFREFVSGQAARERARNAEEFANRALALNRDEVEALWALGETAAFQLAFAQAESFYRQVFALDPRHNRARRSLTWVLRDSDRLPEALAVMQEAIRIDPADVLSRYDLAYVYERGWDFARAAAQLDVVLAARPFSSALINRASLAAKWKGDLAAMRATLDRLDSLDRGDDGAVFMAMWCGLLERQPERVLEAAGRTMRTYLERPDFTGPKAWLPALAQQLAGRGVAAREQWAAAESVLRERLRHDGENQLLRVQLATTLAWLGRAEDAAREIEPVEAAWREDLTPLRAKRLAAHYAAAGDVPRAMPLLRQVLHGGNGMIGLTVPLLELDPWWDKLRAAPEFRALLTNPPPIPALLRPAAAPSTESAASRAAPGAAQPSVPAAVANAKSIAVLPFANLSPDPENAFFADGVHDDVITHLQKIRDLKVISRTSVLAYRDPAARNLAKIAGELGVATIVEASVRRVGTKVRVNAKLLDARTEASRWADTLEGDASDAFALQAKLATEIATALKATLTAGERTLISRRATESADAYDHYLRARAMHLEQGEWGTVEQFERIVAAYEKAIAHDPAFALAYAQVAAVHSNLYWFGYLDPTPARRALLKAAVEAAVRLAPDAPETHFARGVEHYRVSRDWAQALAEFRLAERGMPNDAQLSFWLAITHRRLGRWAEARGYFARAVELNPRDRASCYVAVETLRVTRHYEEGRRLAERVRGFFPGDNSITAASGALEFAVSGDREALVRAFATPVRWETEGHRVQWNYLKALHQGDLMQADRVLATAAVEAMPEPMMIVISIPTAACRALLAHLRGDAVAAGRFAAASVAYYRQGSWNDRQRPWVRMKVAEAMALQGRADEACREGVAALAEMSAQDALDTVHLRLMLGTIYLIVGRRDEAVACLRQMMRDPCDYSAHDFRVDPLWSRLKDDPRFEEILQAARPL